MKLPLKNGSTHTITRDRYQQLQADYPDINVKRELNKMRNWLEANPHKRKVYIDRFIVNWLNQAKPRRQQRYSASHKPFADLNYKL